MSSKKKSFRGRGGDFVLKNVSAEMTAAARLENAADRKPAESEASDLRGSRSSSPSSSSASSLEGQYETGSIVSDAAPARSLANARLQLEIRLNAVRTLREVERTMVFNLVSEKNIEEHIRSAEVSEEKYDAVRTIYKTIARQMRRAVREREVAESAAEAHMREIEARRREDETRQREDAKAAEAVAEVRRREEAKDAFWMRIAAMTIFGIALIAWVLKY